MERGCEYGIFKSIFLIFVFAAKSYCLLFCQDYQGKKYCNAYILAYLLRVGRAGVCFAAAIYDGKRLAYITLY